MTETLTPLRRARGAASRPGRKPSWFVMIVAIIGLGVLLYPSTAQWFSAHNQASEVSGYVSESASIPEGERLALLEEAHRYNKNLPGGPLRDPYTLGADGSQQEIEAIGEDYFEQLKIPGSTAMGRLTIPTINVDLPVYHNTDDATLMKGAGHLFGSALPVGGSGTHSVLTAHSGLPQARMFTDLEDLVEGDTFSVTVLGEKITYQVDQISVVLPTDARELEAVEGKDYMTLISCTPIGINTHRALIRGERIYPQENSSETEISGYGPAGFPWWAVWMTGGIGTSIGLGYLAGRPRKQNHHEGTTSTLEGV